MGICVIVGTFVRIGVGIVIAFVTVIVHARSLSRGLGIEVFDNGQQVMLLYLFLV